MTAAPIVSIERLSYIYEGGIQALDDLSLSIRAGEYVAIVGGNGSGKTTLAKHMNGLLRPTSGRVVVDGRPTSEVSVAFLAARVGYAFQNPDHQLFCTSVEEEVRFGPRNMGHPEEEVARRADDALSLMGIGHLREAPPFSMSLGDRRKVTIAAVLATRPRILLMDEPTTGLDSQEAAQLMALLKRLNGEGMTVVLISHEMRLVAEHADRVVVLSKGRKVLDSGVEDTFGDLALLYESKLMPPSVTELAHRLADEGIPGNVFTPERLAQEVARIGGRSV